MRSLVSTPWMLRPLQMLQLLGEGRLPCTNQQQESSGRPVITLEDFWGAEGLTKLLCYHIEMQFGAQEHIRAYLQSGIRCTS